MMSVIEARRRTMARSYGKLPLTFVENVGHARADIRYYSNRPGYRIGFTSEAALFVFGGNTRDEQEGLALSLRFLCANAAVKIEGSHQDQEKVNLFIGNEPANWHTGLPTYREVVYRELWAGVDLIFRGDNGYLKYDVVLQPGARLEEIRFAYRGADRLSLDEDGNLLIRTANGVLTEERPVSYQEIDGRRVEVASRFVLKQDDQEACVFGFELVGGYDADYPLVIDPVLAYSTYLGGSGTDAGLSIAVDGAGNAYVTGSTNSPNFPVTPGAFQTELSGNTDIFIAKLNPSGSALVYSTYLGGSSSEENPGIAIDNAGNAYIAGVTDSLDYPVTSGAFQTGLAGGSDIFITKLNPEGSNLVYSTYLGGSGLEFAFRGIAIDSAGNAYVTGQTNSEDFPVTAGAFQTALGGDSDTFITKINPFGSALVYSTYLGGSLFEQGNAISVDGSGHAYVSGITTSADFPVTTGAFQTIFGGSVDAFIAKLNPSGTALVYATYLGGSNVEQSLDLAIDSLGSAYVTGSTNSPNFPVTPGAFQTELSGSTDIFITKLNPSGSALVYSTYLGGASDETGFGIAVDGLGHAYVAGVTDSPDFPVTPDAFQSMLRGGFDATLTKFTPDGSALMFSTFLGGSNDDVASSVAVDGAGNAYVTGQTDSSDFPITPGAVQTGLAGSNDAFVAKFEEPATLAARKFSDRFEVRPGETATFFIEVSNTGGATLTNVTISDPLLGVARVIAQLAPAETQIIEAAFTVPAGTLPGLLTNTATITADQLPEPVTASSQILVTEAPSLVLTKTANPSVAAPGATVVFTITVQNTGNVKLLNVALSDPLIGLNETIREIPVGSSVTIDWPFVIPSDAQPGLTIANLIVLRADLLPQPEEVGTAVEVRPLQGLGIAKTADRTVALAGQTVNFTVTAANIANVPQTNVRVDDALAGFHRLIPLLAPGERRVFTLPFTIPPGTTPGTVLRNIATVVSDQSFLRQAEAAIQTAVLPDAALTHTVDRTEGRPGDTVFFTIRAVNTGNVALLNAVLTAPLLGVELRIARFEAGASETLRVPFVLPEVAEDTVITSVATLVSDNGPTRQASASVRVIAEEEEE